MIGARHVITGVKMAKMMTIAELLDSVPMGGAIMVYAPFMEVLAEAGKRNRLMCGEWYDVSAIAMGARTAVVIARREVWNIASEDNILNAQRFFKRYEWHA